MQTTNDRKCFRRPESLIEYIESGQLEAISESTLSKYASVVSGLIDNVGSNSPKLILSTFSQMVASSRISKATGKLYRAAISYWLAEQGLKSLDWDHDSFTVLNDCYRMLGRIDLSRLPASSSRTSALKRKSLSSNALTSLDTLSKSSRFHGRMMSSNLSDAVLYSRANTLLGLRPIEWSDCHLYCSLDKRLIMRVYNAKNSSGRSFGPYRDLDITTVSDDEYTLIVNCIRIVNWHISSCNGDVQSAMNKLQKALYNAQLLHSDFKLDPNVGTGRMTLYSSRHQAIANAKSAGLSREKIAAFFGHRSLKTASRHYASSVSGSGSFSFRPTDETLDLALNFLSSSTIENRLRSKPEPLSRISPIVRVNISHDK